MASPSNRSRAAAGVSFADVVRLARALPDVAESTSYGTPALKVGGKLMARLKEDGETLVLRMDFESRTFLLREQAEIFHLTDHYRDYPWILVRLPRVTAERMAELLDDAWRLVAPRRLVANRDAAPAPTKRARARRSARRAPNDS